MSELLKEIKKLRKEVKEVKNILTDETSREYVQALIDNVSKTDKEMLSEEYLEYWTCDICDEHTHEVDYHYLGNGTNHLGCELKQEELQKKSDKIMKQVEEDMKDYDLSKSESNENSIVDMSATTRRGKK